MSKRLSNFLKVIVTLALLALVVRVVDFTALGRTLATARWDWLLLAWALYQGGILVRACRWRALLVAQGARVPLGRLLALYYVGTFFNNFLPSGFGGDVVKMYELAQDGPGAAISVSTVLLDRILGLLVLLLMALAALPWSWHLVPPTVPLLLVGLAAGTILAGWLCLNRPLWEALATRSALLRRLRSQEKVNAFAQSFAHYGGAALGEATGWSLIFNLSLIGVNMAIARGMGVGLGPGYFFLFVPLLSTLLALPISISGLGVREGGYLLLFGQAGVPPDQAVAMSLLFYALNVVTGLVGGLLYLVQSARGARRR